MVRCRLNVARSDSGSSQGILGRTVAAGTCCEHFAVLLFLLSGLKLFSPVRGSVGLILSFRSEVQSVVS